MDAFKNAVDCDKIRASRSGYGGVSGGFRAKAEEAHLTLNKLMFVVAPVVPTEKPTGTFLSRAQDSCSQWEKCKKLEKVALLPRFAGERSPVG